MSEPLSFERCLSFINCQLHPDGKRRVSMDSGFVARAVTISRQAGCGARIIAQKLADHLQAQSPKESVPWCVFDRNLVERVLEDHHLPKRLARFMPEDHVSAMADTMDELFGLHPASWLLVRQTSETIFHLAELGNVVLIGRGATVITSQMPHVFHVRLVGSLERRLAHIQEYDHLGRKAALEFIRHEDRGRLRYVRKYFQRDLNDPLLYHLVINTDLFPYEQVARVIADAMGSFATLAAGALNPCEVL